MESELFDDIRVSKVYVASEDQGYGTKAISYSGQKYFYSVPRFYCLLGKEVKDET